ncbi:MAG TPA: phosphatase PAP2 family protein [Streptosporangiaceae bacterium]
MTSAVGWFDAGWYVRATDLATHSTWLNGAAAVWTDWGLLVFAALFLAGWWIARPGSAARMAAALWAPIATVAAYAIDVVIKGFVAEPRPCQVIAAVHTVLPCPGAADYSFPSNHATIAAAATVGLFAVSRRLGVVAAVAALLMAASRVYVGAHYPHDVLAGLVVGAVVAGAFLVPATRALSALVVRLRHTPLRPLLTVQPATGHHAAGAR